MARVYTKEEVDRIVREEVKKLDDRIKKLESSDIRFNNVEEKRYGLKVNEKLIIPKIYITDGGACSDIGAIAQRTNVDGDLYICGQGNTWEKVGAQ